MRIHGGALVANAIADQGVEMVFTVSGNQILPVFDAAYDRRLRMVHMRHETAVIYAAIAAAELTGRLAVALVSAGPGFLAAFQGIGVARSMEVPLLFLSGATPLKQRGIGAFQELDQRTLAETLCKASLEPETVDQIGPTIAAACDLARAGVPGPVHVALSSDLLQLPVDRLIQQPVTAFRPFELDDATTTTLDRMADMLSAARRPAIVARPSAARLDDLDALAEILGVKPIITESPRGLSDPKYSAAFDHLRDSDCLLVVAPADFAVGFLDTSIVGDAATVLLIDGDDDPPPSIRPAEHAHVSPGNALAHLSDRVQRETPPDAEWTSRFDPAPPPAAPADDAGRIHPLAVAEVVRRHLRGDDIVVLDGGEFCQWIRLGLRDIPNRVIWNGKLGAIGGSIPMALGAAVTHPRQRVLAILGDGSAGYHLSEFETARRYDITFVAIVGNDARWAAEWHMQASRYGPDRTFDTDLTLARYDQAAEGFGGRGAVISRRADLDSALRDALASPVATCLNVHVMSERSPAEVRH